MPVIEIDQEVFDKLDDTIKASLKEYTPEDTSGLKNKANELLSEKKAADAKAAQLAAELAAFKADQKTKKVDNGDENKLADAMAKLEAAQNEANGLKQAMQNQKIDETARKIAFSISSDERKASLIARDVKDRLQLDGESITVLNQDGKPTISTLDELASETKTRFDFLADGTKATGGGAQGGKGRAVTTAKTMKRADFDALTPADKAKAAKEGVELTLD